MLILISDAFDPSLEGKLAVYQAPAAAPLETYGALAIQLNEGLPTVPGVYHPLLKTSGPGHFAGTYLVTEGPIGLP